MVCEHLDKSRSAEAICLLVKENKALEKCPKKRLKGHVSPNCWRNWDVRIRK